MPSGFKAFIIRFSSPYVFWPPEVDQTTGSHSYVGENVSSVSGAEAASCGKPVVAFDVGGVRECVRDRENGLLVKAGDARELAMALQELLVSDSLRQRIASAAVDSVAKFSLGRMIDETAAIYRVKGLIADH